MKKTTVIASAIFAGMLFISGCQSVPEHIPEELDARQLIQLGQDNYDARHYPAAEKYFNTVLERYGDDPKHYIEAKYELGHLYLKQKKYRAAYDSFSEILEIYENVPIGLPGSYKILCGIELAKIPEDKLAEFKRAPKTPQPAPAATEPEQTAPLEAAPASVAPSPTPTEEPSAAQPEETEEPAEEAVKEEKAEKQEEEKPSEKNEEAPASDTSANE